MKIGLSGSLFEWKTVAEVHPDFWEPSVTEFLAQTDAEIGKMKAEFAERGANLYSAHCLFPSDLRLTGDVDEAAVTAYIEKAFERMHRLGFSVLVFGSGKAKHVPDGFPREKAWEQLVRLCEKMSDVASLYGQTVVVEGLRRQEVNIINTVEEAARLVRDVNRKNVGLLADFYHMAQNGEEIASLARYKDILMHTHIADPVDRGLLTPAHDAFLKECFGVLREMDYRGALAYEGQGGKTAKEYADLLGLLSRY